MYFFFLPDGRSDEFIFLPSDDELAVNINQTLKRTYYQHDKSDDNVTRTDLVRHRHENDDRRLARRSQNVIV